MLVGKAFKQKTLPSYTVGESLMPEYTGRITNIAPKTMLADYERLQSDTNQSQVQDDSAKSWTGGVWEMFWSCSHCPVLRCKVE